MHSLFQSSSSYLCLTGLTCVSLCCPALPLPHCSWLSFQLLSLSCCGLVFEFTRYFLIFFFFMFFWSHRSDQTRVGEILLKSQQCFDCQFTAWVPSRLDAFHAVRVGAVWLHLAHRGTYSTGQEEAVMNTASKKCSRALSLAVVFLVSSLKSFLNGFYKLHFLSCLFSAAHPDKQ